MVAGSEFNQTGIEVSKLEELRNELWFKIDIEEDKVRMSWRVGEWKDIVGLEDMGKIISKFEERKQDWWLFWTSNNNWSKIGQIL